MTPNLILPVLITTLHNLFTAIWIGGMIALAVAVLPALRKAAPDGKSRQQLARTVQARLRVLALISMAGLAVTGLVLTKRGPAAGALFQFGTPYGTALAFKHILMVLMLTTAAIRTFVNQRLFRQPRPRLEKASALLLLLNIVFGVAVLFLSAWLAALAG